MLYAEMTWADGVTELLKSQKVVSTDGGRGRYAMSSVAIFLIHLRMYWAFQSMALNWFPCITGEFGPIIMK